MILNRIVQAAAVPGARFCAAKNGCDEIFASFGFKVPEGHALRGFAGSAWFCRAHRAEGEALKLRCESVAADAAMERPQHMGAAGPKQGSLF